MKRLFCLLLIVAMLTVAASADVLWEPYENDYYMDKAGDFPYMDKVYTVPEGMTANVYESPERGGVVATLDAGSRLYIGPYGEIGGETWAACYALGDWETQGWVRLDRLQQEYDHEAFLEEFAGQITATPVELDTADLNGDIPTWTYPGSGIQDRTLTFTGTALDYNEGKLTCNQVFTDPEDGKWGYVGYFMGRCGWVYLDDLYTTTPPLQLYPQDQNTVLDTSPEEDPAAPSPLTWVLPLAAVLVVATAAALAVLRMKKRQQG